METLVGAAINSGLVTELINMIKQLLGLFAIYPLNIFLVGGLGTIGFTWFRKAKGAARG